MAVCFKDLGNYGRLGNQLFQISATIGLAKRNNDSYIFPKWKYEHRFNLKGCFSDNIKFDINYNEPHFNYKEIPYSSNLNIGGYFQSEKYFNDCSDFIKLSLRPKDYVSEIDAVSIHIRRTDYLKFNRCYTILGPDYYYKAMQMCPSNKYYVFSDDINWCKYNFIGDQFVFVEGNDEVTDLNMMSKCKSNIIANSSFSWWAAYLNNNFDKIVIAPKNWFGPELIKTHSTVDLIPATWIQI
jgi:hypothetical protein